MSLKVASILYSSSFGSILTPKSNKCWTEVFLCNIHCSTRRARENGEDWGGAFNSSRLSLPGTYFICTFCVANCLSCCRISKVTVMMFY